MDEGKPILLADRISEENLPSNVQFTNRRTNFRTKVRANDVFTQHSTAHHSTAQHSTAQHTHTHTHTHTHSTHTHTAHTHTHTHTAHTQHTHTHAPSETHNHNKLLVSHRIQRVIAAITEARDEVLTRLREEAGLLKDKNLTDDELAARKSDIELTMKEVCLFVCFRCYLLFFCLFVGQLLFTPSLWPCCDHFCVYC
jgi:hypothetical protein